MGVPSQTGAGQVWGPASLGAPPHLWTPAASSLMSTEDRGLAQSVVCRVRMGQPPVSSLVARGARASPLCLDCPSWISGPLASLRWPLRTCMSTCLWLPRATSGPCSVETCLKSSETGLSISHQDYAGTFHPGPSTSRCFSLCVPLHASASILFLLLFSLLGKCVIFLNSAHRFNSACVEPTEGPTAADGRGRGGPCPGSGALAVADEGVEA